VNLASSTTDIAHALPGGLYIEIDGAGTLGVATFKWSINGGQTFEQTLVPTAASVTLSGTGCAVAFTAGTYSTNNIYNFYGWVDMTQSAQRGRTRIQGATRGSYQGVVTFSAAETSKVVTFPTLGHTLYNTRFTVVDKSAGAVLGTYYTTEADRATTQMTIRASVAPGGSETVDVYWEIVGYEGVI
jgi:hypothetical protein